MLAGETADWDDDWRVRIHHPIDRGDRAYCSWWDKGLVILDVADPTSPRPVSALEFGHDPPVARRTPPSRCPVWICWS